MKRAFVYALFCLIVFPGIAHAQLIERACGGHMPCNFEQFKAGEVDWFKKADVNHDGIIDAKEQALFWQNYAQDILPDCKDMQDIKVLKLNHIPTDDQMRKTFASVDANGDGIIDAQEDRQATMQIDQACQLLRNPQIQKLQQMFQQFQQGSSKSASPSTGVGQ